MEMRPTTPRSKQLSLHCATPSSYDDILFTQLGVELPFDILDDSEDDDDDFDDSDDDEEDGDEDDEDDDFIEVDD